MIGSIDTIGDEATLTQMPYQWPKVRKLLEAARRHVGLLITSAVGSFVCVENDPLRKFFRAILHRPLLADLRRSD
jgi:hypothetical protein